MLSAGVGAGRRAPPPSSCGSRSRRPSPAAAGGRRPAPPRSASLICVLGPEGRHRQDAHQRQPRRRARRSRGTRVVIVDLDLQFGDVGLSLGLVAAAHDLRPRQVGRVARRREGRGLPDAALERRPGADGAGAAGPGGRGDDRVPARALSAAASEQRLRDRRHAARLHARGDRARSTAPRTSAWSGMLDSLSLKNTKLGPRDARAHGLRAATASAWCSTGPTRNVGVTQDDVTRDRRAPARRAGPEPPRRGALGQRGHADRAQRQPRSEAAQAFRALADLYAGRPPDAKRPRLPAAEEAR